MVKENWNGFHSCSNEEAKTEDSVSDDAGDKEYELPEPFGDKIEDDKKIINHPQRYGGDTIYECIKVLEAWLKPDEYRGFLKGNCIKYICRVGKKDDEVQELEKAKWYLEKMIESYKK